MLGRALALLMPLMTASVLVLEWNGIPRQPRDTLAYYDAATAARSDSDVIYRPVMASGPHDFAWDWYFIYPPVLAAVLSLLPAMSYVAFDRLWLVLNLASFWLLAVAFSRIARGRYDLHSILGWSAVLFIMPGAVWCIRFGNIDLMVLTLLAWGLVLPAAGGGFYFSATVVKATPVWPLLVLLIRRARPSAACAAGAALACSAVCLLAFGARDSVLLFVDWLTRVMPTLAQGQFWGGSLARLQQGGLSSSEYADNLSLSFLPVQLLVISGWNLPGGPLPMGIQLYLSAVAVGVPLLTGWLTRHNSVNVQVAAVAAAAYLAAPLVRPYVLPIVLLLAATKQQERRERRHQHRTAQPK